MTEMSLNGHTVLVVDDDYYLAENTRQALEEANATVLGPYGDEDEAIASLEEQPPQYAVVDLNLGSGPSFAIARSLKVRGIPMLLVTGYDRDIIPPDLAGTPCLQKPVSNATLVAAVSDLVG